MSLGRWLQEQLFERRIVLVTGQLDDGAAAKAAAALLALGHLGTPRKSGLSGPVRAANLSSPPERKNGEHSTAKVEATRLARATAESAQEPITGAKGQHQVGNASQVLVKTGAGGGS